MPHDVSTPGPPLLR